MDADGHISVRMDADGCMDTDGSKNKTKRVTNLRSGHVFGRMTTDKNSRKLAKMVVVFFQDHVDQEGGNNGCVVQK